MSILRSLITKFNPLLNFQRCYRKPTASHIVNVDRPKRPSYFNSGSLYYEIAVPKDRDIVMDFMLKHFRVDGPFQKAVQATEDEVIDFYSDIVDKCLASGLTTLAFDGNKLESVQLSRPVDVPADNKQLFDFNDPLFTAVKPDYAEDIKNGPYKYEKANKMYVYINALQRDFVRLFPPKQRIYVMEVVGVSQAKRGYSVTVEMGYIGFRYSREKGCESTLATAVSPKLEKIVGGQKHHIIARVLPFKDFKANGVPVFGDKLKGGGVLMFSEYETMTFMRHPTLYMNLFKIQKYANVLKRKLKIN